MASKSFSVYFDGLEAKEVIIEASILNGLPSFSIVGLPENSVKESRERIRTSIKHNRWKFPDKKIVVNLSPGDIKKEGSHYDLPIAMSLLKESGVIADFDEEQFVFLGELSLEGEIRAVRGVVSAAIFSKKKNKTLLVPYDNAKEAALVLEDSFLSFRHIKEVVEFLNGNYYPEKDIRDNENFYPSAKYDIDFSDVKGQFFPKRALEIAASGWHNVLMIGPPGSGKSMLAKRVPTILPDMGKEEVIETTLVYSIAGKLKENSIVRERPFRAPHHTISDIGLIGGGKPPRPGEISLAHNGVLFMDEFPEFKRNAIESLREPLEEKRITISRAGVSAEFPANFLLIAAMNPCSEISSSGDCPYYLKKKYISKISKPILDRIDLVVEVRRVPLEEIENSKSGESSEDIKERVKRAHKIQKDRFRKRKIHYNSQMKKKDIEKLEIEPKAISLLKLAYKKLGLTARAYDRVKKVSRTIADLEGSEIIKEEHIAEALQYRGSEELLY